MKHPGRVSWLLAALLLFSPQLTVLASENAAMESLAESPVVSPAETAPGSEVSAEENAAAAAESEGTEGMQSSAEVSSAGSYEAGDETLVTERAAADSAATCEIPAEENAAATDSATACEIPAADVSADETQTEAKAGFSEEEAEPAVIKTRTVYLDAALSGICYQDSPAGSGSGIPGEDGIVRYAVNIRKTAAHGKLFTARKCRRKQKRFASVLQRKIRLQGCRMEQLPDMEAVPDICRFRKWRIHASTRTQEIR